MNNSTLNLEEAVNIASEFIYSIDNLPNEVQFLLSEIRVKDTRAQEIQQEIDRESAKYVRHVRSGSSSSTPFNSGISSSSSPSNSTTPGPTTNHSSSSSAVATSPTLSRAGSPKPNAASVAAAAAASAPTKIAASYAEIQQLCDEKCALAQRLIELINRTRARLEHDLAKIRVLQGESVEYTGAGVIGAATGVGKLNGTPGMAMITSAAAAVGAAGLAGVDGALGRNSALQLSESLRSALRASPSISAAESASAGGTGSATKRRRLGTSASIKLTTPSRRRSASPATTVTTTTTHTHQRSRLSRQVVPPEESEEEAEEENAEEMEDVDADDDKIYCFCRKKSFGDMIACDNEGNCPYEWFHLSCVGLKQPPPETWYCSVCSANMTKGGSGSTRKGRKK